MTTETAQPAMAAESEVAPIDAAADAFKAFVSGEPIERPRDEHGRFASTKSEATEIEAEEGSTELETAENDGETGEEVEAAEEAQPEPIEMPSSWAKEDADVWTALPPEAQAKIAEREGQRDAAVNQKFQEAANARKSYETIATEAQTSRAEALALIEQVQNLIVPQRPPVSMLNPQSGDYNPDAYHLAYAQFEQANELLGALGQQRQQLAAQQKETSDKAWATQKSEIEQKCQPAFLTDFPDIADPEKSAAAWDGLVRYGIERGIPAETFGPDGVGFLTSAELHILWQAREYEKLKAKQAEVKAQPKPEPRKPQPVVKPGVATPRGAIEQTRFKGAMDRLSKSGSLQDGAAVFKHFLKGS